MPLWKRLLRLVVIAALTPVIFLLSCQSSLIYHPRANDADALRDLEASRGRRVSYTTAQGRQEAYYVPPPFGDASQAPVWLCFAGNGSLALDWLRLVQDWDGRFAYLLVDYPAYGACEGRPTPKSIRQSSVAAMDALAAELQTTREALAARTLVLGHSLGAAAALMAAEDLGLTRGLLVSPFTSMTDMGRIVLGWPLCHLNLHRFDNSRTLSRVVARQGARMVIFHGAEDEVIPVRMGRDLARAHPAAVTWHEVPGAHHNDILRIVSARMGLEMRKLVFSELDLAR